MTKCKQCKGTGQVDVVRPKGVRKVTCPKCGGAGMTAALETGRLQ